jgi:predicted transposase YbfD/YdcC
LAGKQTNEIKIAIPLLDSIDISGKTITADALLTQREIASYLVAQKNAHYHFTAKGNQKQLMENIAFRFKNIENSCHYVIDWNYDEDRSRIAKGYVHENITRLRRFAVDLLKSKGVLNVSQKMRQLLMTPRMVLDYLKMTWNSRCASKA